MIFASTKEAVFHFKDDNERISICREDGVWVRIFASIENDEISVCIETENELVADLKTNFFDPSLGYQWQLEAEEEGEAIAIRLNLWNAKLCRVID